MECPAGQLKKELPKRLRYPPKKIQSFEPNPGLPKDEDGVFVFLTFEDGYTAKIFKTGDILHKDDKPITCFRDLKPGEMVLARWSDKKFYNATVDYIATADKTVDTKKGTKKDRKKSDAAAERFYNLPSPSQAAQFTSIQPQEKSVEQGVMKAPPTQPLYQPLPAQSSPPTQPLYQPLPAQSSPPTQPLYQPLPAQSSPPTQPLYQPLPAQSSPPTQPLYQPLPAQSSPPTQPLYQPLPAQSSPPNYSQYQPPLTHPQYWPTFSQSSLPTHSQYQPLPVQPLNQSHPTQPPVSLCSSFSQYPQFQNHPLFTQKHHRHHNAQPMPSDKLQWQPGLVDLDKQQNQTTPKNPTAKESFMKMLYTTIIPEAPSVFHTKADRASTSEYESSTPNSSSSLDTDTMECNPLPAYGEPCLQTESRRGMAWEPCAACKSEVAKLMEDKGKLENVLCSISGEQLEAVKSFLDKVEHVRPQGGVAATKNRSGKQELYPESGLFLSSTRLAAIHAEARKDCLRLFHLLFDEFFTAAECQSAVAFGKHGKVPEGKTVLDKSKVNGILTYIMRCGTLDGWTAVEKTKVKKALINKCHMRASKTL